MMMMMTMMAIMTIIIIMMITKVIRMINGYDNDEEEVYILRPCFHVLCDCIYTSQNLITFAIFLTI